MSSSPLGYRPPPPEDVALLFLVISSVLPPLGPQGGREGMDHSRRSSQVAICKMISLFCIVFTRGYSLAGKTAH